MAPAADDLIASMPLSRSAFERRALLIGGAASAMTLACGAAFGQSTTGPRVAVVIGVDHAGTLPILSAAASGAHEVADWLKGQGFEVKLFADDAGQVQGSAIFATIAEIVGRGTVVQLIIYFAGHGFISQQSEYWMLSQAPENPNEAIGLNGSVYLARLQHKS